MKSCKFSEDMQHGMDNTRTERTDGTDTFVDVLSTPHRDRATPENTALPQVDSFPSPVIVSAHSLANMMERHNRCLDDSHSSTSAAQPIAQTTEAIEPCNSDNSQPDQAFICEIDTVANTFVIRTSDHSDGEIHERSWPLDKAIEPVTLDTVEHAINSNRNGRCHLYSISVIKRNIIKIYLL